MNRLRVGSVIVVIAGCACTASALTYLWTGGGGPNGLWTNCANWSALGEDGPCYPATLEDDALFAASPDGVPVELVQGITIDDLIITSSVTFVSDDPAAPPRTLVTDSVTIKGESGLATVVISLGGKARIRTEDRTP